MREKEGLEDIQTRKALVEYVDKARRIPRVRSFFDALILLTNMPVWKSGKRVTTAL
jgi:hypothetical protein